MFKKYIEKIVRNEIAYMKENEKQDKKMYENSEIYALKSENSSLKKEIEKLKITSDDLMQNIIHYTNENFDLKNQIISLEKELEKLKVVPEIAKFNVKPIYSEYSKNEYLHQSQIAKRFGYSESTISYWVKKGKLKPRGFKNKRIIFCVAEVERDLKAIGKFKGIIGTD